MRRLWQLASIDTIFKMIDCKKIFRFITTKGSSLDQKKGSLSLCCVYTSIINVTPEGVARLGQPRRKGRLKCEFLIPVGVPDPVTAPDQAGREGGREMPSPRRMRRIAFTQTPLFTSLSKTKSISTHFQKCSSY